MPAALAGHGSLDLFATDLYLDCHERSVIQALRRLVPLASLDRLAARHSQSLAPERVRSFPAFAWLYRRRLAAARTAGARTAAWLWGGARFCELAARLLRPSQDTVYAYSSTARELFLAGHARGMRLVLDHATAPRRHEMRLVEEEAERFAGWAASPERDDMIDAYHERQMAEAALADRIVCASSFARRALIEHGVPAEKIRLVPLGIAPRFFDVRAEPGSAAALRVLFVGGDGLRKGVGYLAAARRRLGSNRIVVKVAGDLDLSAAALRTLADDVDLLGPVARGRIFDLYRWADVVVLPSVSDTFGLVVLEAMAAGLPVIASENSCGPDVIRDGVDGFVVPIRDADAIAARLDVLAGDPGRLKEMGRQARRRARFFAGPAYADRLMAALSGA